MSALFFAAQYLLTVILAAIIFLFLEGVLFLPFFFILSDIIAEIFGYKVARFTIWCGFFCLILFATICQLIVNAPLPHFATLGETYYLILGPSLLGISISSLVAYVIANLVNIKIITRWKILLKGKKFWLRFLGASMFSEILYSLIAIMMMGHKLIDSATMIQVICLSCSIKLVYSAALAWPANYFVLYIKNLIGIDVFDPGSKFTPFSES